MSLMSFHQYFWDACITPRYVIQMVPCQSAKQLGVAVFKRLCYSVVTIWGFLSMAPANTSRYCGALIMGVQVTLGVLRNCTIAQSAALTVSAEHLCRQITCHSSPCYPTHSTLKANVKLAVGQQHRPNRHAIASLKQPTRSAVQGSMTVSYLASGREPLT